MVASLTCSACATKNRRQNSLRGGSVMDKRATAWLLCVLSVSCTTLLGIDDDYHARPIEPGGGSDASSGIGGGGLGASGGSGGNDASESGGSGGTCADGQKYCQDGGCFPPDPIIGCSLNGCEACPAPPEHAVPACNGEQLCDFVCVPDYERRGDGCVPSGAGGAAGQDGSSGSGGSPPGDAGACSPVVCPADGGCGDCRPCVAPIPAVGCCLADGTCGGLVLGGCFRCFL